MNSIKDMLKTGKTVIGTTGSLSSPADFLADSGFDFILFDSAPILPVTDSVILSELMDAKLLVARFGATERQSVERSYSLLCGANGDDKNVSIVVNAVQQNNDSYYAYYGYSESVYHQHQSIEASVR